ncbi:MAG: chemotaxis protein histidine kinase CheA [Pirellulaceae bacterium]|jgi:chemotaxis protein histidine kinase CheA
MSSTINQLPERDLTPVFTTQVTEMVQIATSSISAISQRLGKKESIPVDSVMLLLNKALRAIHQTKTMGVVVGHAEIQLAAADMENYLDTILAEGKPIDQFIVDTLQRGMLEVEQYVRSTSQQQRTDNSDKPKTSFGRLLQAFRQHTRQFMP